MSECCPRCPKCGKPSAAPYGPNPHAYYCHSCDMPFEDCDDGDIGQGRPDVIAERREEYRLRQQAKRTGRLGLSTDFTRFKESKLRGGLGR